jgi:hypothetical protein
VLRLWQSPSKEELLFQILIGLALVIDGVGWFLGRP